MLHCGEHATLRNVRNDAGIRKPPQLRRGSLKIGWTSESGLRFQLLASLMTVTLCILSTEFRKTRNWRVWR
jgi:hypothetical protein